jgi:outer membrane receptor for ferrienterochelin and colicins
VLSLVVPLLLTQLDAGAEEELFRGRQTVVTANRAERKLEDVVVGTEVITRAQIEAVGARDLTQLLQQHPGVELVTTNRSVGVRLQGLDPEYTLILIDGQRISGRAGPSVDISRFSLRELERVEIVKGPGAAIYGAEAMGGVINLITRRPQKPFEASLRGSFGTLLEGDVRGNMGGRLGAFELRGGGGFRRRDSYSWDAGLPPNVTEPTSLPSQRRFDGDVEVAYAPKNGVRLWLRGGYVWSDFTGVDVNDSRAVFDRRQRTEQVDVWAGGQTPVWEGAVVTVRGHFGYFRDQFMLDQRSSRDLDDYSQSIARLFEGYAQLDQRIADHQLSVGIEGFGESLSSTRLNINTPSRGRFAAFIQDEWAVGGSTAQSPRLTLLPGFRVDADTQFGAAPSPRLALKADINKALSIRASAGLGFRPPTFTELYFRLVNPGIGYIVEGNTSLTAERSASVSVSADWRPPIDGWVVSGSLWHTSLTNLINVTGSTPPNPDMPSVFGYENVANAYTQGGELTARFRLSRGAYLDVGYMGLDARDVTRGRQLEGRSAHRVNAQLTAKYKPSGLEAVVRGTLHSARPFYIGQGGGGVTNVLGFGEATTAWAPAYVDLELQLTYTRAWFKAFINAYNLLNQGDAQFNPRPPIGVLGGIQVEY